MINPKKLYQILEKNGISNYIGVPDSVLKNFLELIPSKKNLVSTNEGSAVSYGIGYHLSTKKIPLVYLQNSGLGNAINPLISIASKKVYSIPLALLIGWRGSTNSKDEPQHIAQGKITRDLLNLLGIRYLILNKDRDLNKINKLLNFSKYNNIPIALLVENGIIKKVTPPKKHNDNNSDIKRIIFLKELLKLSNKNYKFISTTGFTSRELYQLRKECKNLGSDFYNVGGMGHVASIALGYSRYSKNKVVVLDGDGSLLMHLGSLAKCGVLAKNNFKYILLNNFSHESVGGQKTLINNINLKKLSNSLGFKNYYEISRKKNVNKILNLSIKKNFKTFMNIKIMEGSIKNLVRPKGFLKIKKEFMK